MITAKQPDKEGYSYPVDFWALGCLTFELLHSYSPFSAKTAKQIFYRVLQGDRHDYGRRVSAPARSMISGLLQADPQLRSDETQVWAEPFFTAHYHWTDLLSRSVPPPTGKFETPSATQGNAEPSSPAPNTDRKTEQASFGSLLEARITSSAHHWLEKTASFETASVSSCDTNGTSSEKLVVAQRWAQLQSECCVDRTTWSNILDECFMYCLPSAVFRHQYGAFNENGVKVLVGIDAFIEDMRAGMQPLEDGVDGCVLFCIDESSALETPQGLLWSGWASSRGQRSRSTQVIMSMHISKEGKITKIQQAMDVITFSKQLRRHQSKASPEDTFASPRPFGIFDLNILGKLGQGNFCEVWKARITSTGSIVAMKSQPVAFEAELVSEMKLHEKMKHPFIIELLGAFELPEKVCVVMEYVGTGTLLQIQNGFPMNRLPLEAVRFYASEIAVALIYIHSRGVIFNDLKPEKIIVQDSGHVKLTDFESASEVVENGKGKAGDLSNCIDYHAPEILMGMPCSTHTDWWVFGCLVFELAVGVGPFDSDDIVATKASITAGTRIEFPFEVDPHFASLVNAFLKPDPTDRLNKSTIECHDFFLRVDWQAVEELRAVPWNPAQANSLSSGDTMDAVEALEEDSWQFHQAEKFFSLYTQCCTDPLAWSEVVESIFLFTTPNLPYRDMSASKVDPSTNLYYIVGAQELAHDADIASATQEFPVEMSVAPDRFCRNMEHGFAALTVKSSTPFGSVAVAGAARMIFSASSELLTRVEICFNVYEFMAQLNDEAKTSVSPFRRAESDVGSLMPRPFSSPRQAASEAESPIKEDVGRAYRRVREIANRPVFNHSESAPGNLMALAQGDGKTLPSQQNESTTQGGDERLAGPEKYDDRDSPGSSSAVPLSPGTPDGLSSEGLSREERRHQRKERRQKRREEREYQLQLAQQAHKDEMDEEDPHAPRMNMSFPTYDLDP